MRTWRTTTLWIGSVLCASAWAQQGAGGVTVYGIVDSGIEYARTTAGATTAGATSSNVVTGSQSASRLGVRVQEDLGGGMRAVALIEHGFDIDTGGQTGPAFWGRDAYVGLGGAWGEVRLGRTYTPGFFVLLFGDINRLGFYGNAGGYARLGPTGQVRAANGVNYISPSLAGVTVRATYAFGESGTAPRDAGRVAAISAEYAGGPLYAGVFHHVRRDVFPAGSGTSASTTYTGASARYDFAALSLAAGTVRFDPAGPDTATAGVFDSWWLAALVKVGAGDVRLTGGQLKTRLAAGATARGTMIALAYSHPLSKRTSLYATVGTMNNNDRGSFVLEASSRAIALPVSAGTDTRGLAVGIRHTF